MPRGFGVHQPIRGRRGRLERRGSEDGACTFAEDPDRSALDARILWTREFDPAVLSVLAEPGLPGDPDSIDLSALNLPCIAAVAAPQLLHVVLGDGMRRLRLDMCGSATLACPLKLACRLGGLARAEQRVMTLRRLLFLTRHGHFGQELWPAEVRPRDILLLRVHDALMTGASYREIATDLYGAERAAEAWAGGSDSLKSRVRRLAAKARKLAAGAWRDLV